MSENRKVNRNDISGAAVSSSFTEKDCSAVEELVTGMVRRRIEELDTPKKCVDAGVAERYIARLGIAMMEEGYLGPRQHWLLLGCLAFAAVILVCAPRAILGLHYQCLLSSITGIRCPFCGMTRDFILLSQGSLPRNNPGSIFVAVAGYLVYPVWFMVATLCRPSLLVISRKVARDLLIATMVLLFVCNNVVR